MSDTIQEIRADEWWYKHLGDCQTCMYYKRRGKYELCDMYGTDIENISECDEWIERKAVKSIKKGEPND